MTLKCHGDGVQIQSKWQVRHMMGGIVSPKRGGGKFLILHSEKIITERE